MAVNRFDNAADVQYISQYTPIPFQELYNLGKAYNDRVDKTYDDLSNAIKQYKQFRSPSAIDTQRYYDLTLKGAEEIADKIANNPDFIKSVQGQAEIQKYINSRPYTELRMLEQSRDNMLQRQKNVSELIKDGKYNPLWHDYDFTNYDTLGGRGLFKDTNVLPYTSEIDLVKPYLDNLKDGYIRTQGGFDYYGVTPEQVLAQINPNMSAILNSPYSREHIKSLIRQGYSPQDAYNIFSNNIQTAAREFAHETRKTNPFAAMNYNDQLIRARWADPNNPANKDKNPNNPNSPLFLTNSIQTTGLDKYIKGRADVLSRNPNYANIIIDLYGQDPIKQEKAKALMQQLNEQNSTPQQLFRTIFNNYGTKTNNGGLQLNTNQLTQATNDILNEFSVPIRGNYNQLLINTIPGISSKEQTTPLGKYRTISSGANLDLATRSIAAIAGLNPPDQPVGRNKFLNELKGGGLNNIIVLGNERLLTIPTVDSSGNPSTQNIQTLRVAISADEIKSRGLTDSDMKQVGAVKYNIPGKQSSTNTLSGSYSDNQANYEKVSSSQTSQTGNEYWMVNLTSEVPIDMLGAEYLNQSALQQNVNPSTYSSLYPEVQEDAFDLQWLNVDE